MAACDAGSTMAVAARPCSTTLTRATVAVIECTYPDFSSASSVDAFNACVAQAFSNEAALFALSEERDFSVQ